MSCSTDAYGKHYSCAKRLKISELVTTCRVPLRVLVIAVAGSQGFADWRTNFRSTSSSPKDVLTDDENYCHDGFLAVTRELLAPLANDIRSLVRSGTSVLFTGHSSGGAIASLLYAHVGAGITSALNEALTLSPAVHCIVFGSPPVSLKPLEQYRKRHCDGSVSLFLSIINEGDPIVKADREYLLSKCLGRPTRGRVCESPTTVIPAHRKRKLVHSGSVLLLHNIHDGASFTTIPEVDNEALDQTMAHSWSAHKIVAYEENLAGLPIAKVTWRPISDGIS